MKGTDNVEMMDNPEISEVKILDQEVIEIDLKGIAAFEEKFQRLSNKGKPLTELQEFLMRCVSLGDGVTKYDLPKGNSPLFKKVRLSIEQQNRRTEKRRANNKVAKKSRKLNRS